MSRSGRTPCSPHCRWRSSDEAGKSKAPTGGRGRLRAEQRKRDAFAHLLHRLHPLGTLYVDKVYEYAGTQIAFYRRTVETSEEARVAVFDCAHGVWRLLNDMIAVSA
jgi:hypothetical protein